MARDMAKDPLRVIIAGGRDLSPTKLFVESCVGEAMLKWRDELRWPWVHYWHIEAVVGGCRGIDRIAEDAMRNALVPVKVFDADWETHGKKAGPMRNAAMAEYAEALVLIWDGKSKGSASMKREAKRRGLWIHEVIVPTTAEVA